MTELACWAWFQEGRLWHKFEADSKTSVCEAVEYSYRRGPLRAQTEIPHGRLCSFCEAGKRRPGHRRRR